MARTLPDGLVCQDPQLVSLASHVVASRYHTHPGLTNTTCERSASRSIRVWSDFTSYTKTRKLIGSLLSRYAVYATCVASGEGPARNDHGCAADKATCPPS